MGERSSLETNRRGTIARARRGLALLGAILHLGCSNPAPGELAAALATPAAGNPAGVARLCEDVKTASGPVAQLCLQVASLSATVATLQAETDALRGELAQCVAST